MERYVRELESPAALRTRHRRFVAALAAAFALLIGIAAYGVVQNRRAEGARAFVARNLTIQEATLQLENAGTRMEVHQRGFLLTGDSTLVDLRERAFATGQEAALHLSMLVAGDIAQARLANRVAEALRVRHARMLEVTEIAAAQGMEAAREAFRSRAVGVSDPVLAGVAALREAQHRHLDQVTARANRAAARFTSILLCGTALALLVVVMTSMLMLRQLSRNARLGRELLRLNREQKARGIELERSNRELEAFTYSISHDLRAPLRHIDGYARMLQEDAGDLLSGDLRRYLDAIGESSRRMGALIDDLLAYSRLGRKPVERLPLDMNAFIGQVLPDAGSGASHATVHVDALPQAIADPVLMRQAWVNLLSNALKYSAPRGEHARIEISGERDGDMVRYRIRDNGVGFDMRYADKLFGVFQRLHSQDEFEGTGVGLAIVQQIVERHGGRVSAEATPGEGACFTIELPAEAT